MIDRREAVRDFACIAGLAGVAAVLFADVLFAGAGFYTRDLFAYHYALKHTVVETVRSGSFPYWNRFIAGGQPLAANPALELFYPPQWLVFTGSYATTFQLHILLHVGLALVGMFLFLRALKLSRAAAIFGAASFGFGGLFLGTLPMLPMFFVWSWAPLCALSLLRFLENRGPRRLAIAALVFAMPLIVFEPVALGELWLLALAGAIWRERLGDRRYLRAIGSVLLAGAASALIAAVVVVPAIDHARDSARVRGFSYETMMQCSMPLARPLEIAVPHLFGMLDQTKVAFWGTDLFDMKAPYVSALYCGFGVLIFAIAGLLLRMPGSRFVLATAAIAYLLAIGRASPLMNLLFEANVRAMRYPEKFIFGAGVVAIVFAAAAADRFLRGEASRQVLIAAVSVAALNIALAAFTFAPFFPAVFFRVWGYSVIRLAIQAHSTWTLGALIALAWLAVLYGGRRERSRAWFFASILLLLVDLGTFANDVASRAPRSFFLPPPAEEALRGDDGQFTVFHRGEWLPDDPNFIAQRGLMPSPWLVRNGLRPYSPALRNHRTILEPDWDETALLPTHDLLDRLLLLGRAGGHWSEPLMTIANVGTVIDYAPPSPSEENFETAVPVIVRNVPFRQPRYFFATKLVPVSEFNSYVRAHPVPLVTAFVDGTAQDVAGGRVIAAHETADEAVIDVDAAGPAFLVMTVTRHKYWSVTIDGTAAQAVAANLAFQGVRVPPGQHRVTMRYSNPLIPLSGAVSLLALIGALAAIVRA